jgi:sensor domain CHASE-containing protein
MVSGSARLVTAGLLVACLASAQAEDRPPPPRPVDTLPAVDALQALRRAWFDELDELTATVRAIAVANDSYEFVAYPNIPYVITRFARERLAATHLDTVLIIDRMRKPLFWRRLSKSGNRGFADAEAFLGELPALPPPGDPGVPGLVGAAQFASGPALVVAMPIYAASSRGKARGWLIAARVLDVSQWQRYEERAHLAAGVLDPVARASPGDIEAGLKEPLAPVVHADASHIRGLIVVPDLQGHVFRVFSVQVARPTAVVASPVPAPAHRQGLWFTVAAIIVAVNGIAGSFILVLRRRARASV